MADVGYNNLSTLVKPVGGAPPATAAPESPTTAEATASDDDSYSDDGSFSEDSSDGGFDEFKVFLKGRSAAPAEIFAPRMEKGGQFFDGDETETYASTLVSSDSRDFLLFGELGEPNFCDDAVASSDAPLKPKVAPAGAASKEDCRLFAKKRIGTALTATSEPEPESRGPSGEGRAPALVLRHGPPPEPERAGASAEVSLAESKQATEPWVSPLEARPGDSLVESKQAMEPWVSPLASVGRKPAPKPKPKPAPRSARKLRKESSAARARARAKEPVEPLPIDYFNKQGEALAEARAKADRELAEAETPFAIAYFTAKGREDKTRRISERRALSERNMYKATRHFKSLSEEAKGRSEGGGEAETMPAAIQYFTLMHSAKEEKKQSMKENPPPMPNGQAHFTDRWLADKERERARIRELRTNPPPAPVSTRHFLTKEEERRAEIERLRSMPAPNGIEYFTRKAREEKEEARRADEAREALRYELPVANRHFVRLEAKRAAEIEAARVRARANPPEPLPIDYFAKLDRAAKEARAAAARELAESLMPNGVAYFTKKGREDRARRDALTERHMPVSTRHFRRLSEEAKGRRGGEAETMPTAIQHFTLPYRAKKEKARRAVEDARENPPPVPNGQAYFTDRWLADRERERARNRELRTNPPPALVSTRHFRIKEEERRAEIERLRSEPAPAGIEHFTRKAREKKERSRRALERANSVFREPSVASMHFARLEGERAASGPARRGTRRSERRSLDWGAVAGRGPSAVQ